MNLLSRRSVLAIAAVVDVALHSRSAPVGAKVLAQRHKLPPRHLETVLQGLVHAKILKGVRGPRGGYELARERRRITVGEIVRTAMSLSTADPDEHVRLIGGVAHLFNRDRVEVGEKGFARPAYGRINHPLKQHRV
jgi:Rrf2 family protein